MEDVFYLFCVNILCIYDIWVIVIYIKFLILCYIYYNLMKNCLKYNMWLFYVIDIYFNCI